MSCEQYSSGTNAEITLTEHSLPVGFCPATWQDVLHAFIAATSGNLPGSYSTLVVSAATPSPNDQDKLWLKVDTTTCHPEGFYLFFNGAWARVDGGVFYGEDNSTAVGTINVSTLEPNISWLETAAAKQLFVIKANTGNTGAVTLQLPLGIAAMTVTKYGGVALEGYEIRPGMLCLFAYDVSAGKFQLLNPRPNIPTVEGLENPSFEVDTDGNLIPDLWVPANTFGGPNGVTGIIDTVYPDHGSKCFKIQVYAPVASPQNGWETLTTANAIKCNPGELVYISWQLMAEVDALKKPASIKIFPFTNTGGARPTQTIWSSDLAPITDYPAGIWRKYGALFVADATTTSFKIQIQVGNSDNSGKIAKWVYFDDFRIGPPQLMHGVIYNVPGNYRWVCPANIYRCRIRCWGAGASPGHRTSTLLGGGGGGAGAYTESFRDVIPATAYAIHVGSGIAGSNGEDTTFNLGGTNQVIAGGGNVGADGNAGGGGGTGGSPDVSLNVFSIQGGNGGQAIHAPPDRFGGDGGDCPNGGSGGWRSSFIGLIGNQAGNYPGGGAGGPDDAGFDTRPAGGHGQLIIDWF